MNHLKYTFTRDQEDPLWDWDGFCVEAYSTKIVQTWTLLPQTAEEEAWISKPPYPQNRAVDAGPVIYCLLLQNYYMIIITWLLLRSFILGKSKGNSL